MDAPAFAGAGALATNTPGTTRATVRVSPRMVVGPAGSVGASSVIDRASHSPTGAAGAGSNDRRADRRGSRGAT